MKVKCIFCNTPVQIVEHPGTGRMVHHGDPGCRNSGVHSLAAWDVMSGDPFENVVSSMSAEEVGADPELVAPVVSGDRIEEAVVSTVRNE